MAKHPGKDCSLYYNTATYASPTWSEIQNVGDVTIPDDKEKAEASTRRSRVKEYLSGMKEVGIEFQMFDDPADTALAAIRAAYDADTTLEFLVLNGDTETAGSTGWRMTCEIFKCQEGQPLNGADTQDIAVAPSAAAANAPARYTVTT